MRSNHVPPPSQEADPISPPPSTLLATFTELLYTQTTNKPGHPFCRVLHLPHVSRLPAVATRLKIFTLGVEQTADDDFTHVWVECERDSRQELYQDAIDIIRGNLTLVDHTPNKVERTKWVARQCPERQGSFSFNLSLVQVSITKWKVFRFEDDDPEQTWEAPRKGYYVPADEAHAFLWKKYGLNLLLLSLSLRATVTDPPQMLESVKAHPGWHSTAGSALEFFRLGASGGKPPVHPRYALDLPWSELWELDYAPGFDAAYFSLNMLAIIVGHVERGLLDCAKGRDVATFSAAKPLLLCGLRFSSPATSDEVSVIYTDGSDIEPKATVLLPGGLSGKPHEAFLRLLRLRKEISKVDHEITSVTQRLRLLRISHEFSVSGEPTVASTVQGERERRRVLEKKRDQLSADANASYQTVVSAVGPHKEKILSQYAKIVGLQRDLHKHNSRWAQRQDLFVKFPSPLEGLPAHMALLPAGFNSPLLATIDPFGRPILKVTRPTTDQARPFPLDLYFPEEPELRQRFTDGMSLIFHGRQWILAQGIIAFAKLYQEGNGYREKGRSVRITVPEWCRAMRPDEKSRQRIAAKGTSGLFGSNLKTSEVFHGFFAAAAAMHFPDPRDRGHTIAGLITITGYGTEAGRSDYVQVALNPDLFDLMVGRKPMYMITNAEAMLSYREQELSYLPASQFGLELLARQNLYDRNTSTLCNPKGDGIAVATFMSKFGLVKGPREAPSTVKDRVYRILDTLRGRGVVERFKRDGRERDDWQETKLFVTMSDDYWTGYNIAKKRQSLAREEELLAAPFEPTRRSKKV